MLFQISLGDEGAPVDAAVADALGRGVSPGDDAALLGSVAQGDPYLAEQLRALRAGWELRPEPPGGLAGRLRARLAWWLLGPELRQASRVNATLLRLCESLVATVDAERAARRRVEEQLAGHPQAPRDAG